MAAASPLKRLYPEPPPSLRTETQRDRDRVLYTSSFQRLAGITQIASPDIGSILHNRLTHSLKVAQVARRLAEAAKSKNSLRNKPLMMIDRLDPDAVETAALAHDLGHPPFGHVAEKKLDVLSAGWGGFEGNAQSFRIITTIAQRDSRYKGLNLTRVCLNGLLKYPWFRDPSDRKKASKWGAYMSESTHFDWARKGLATDRRTVEAEIMDWADDVTYAVHDMEDFHKIGLVPLDRLASDEAERSRFVESFKDDAGALLQKFTDEGLTEGDVLAATDFLFSGLLAGLRPFDGTRSARATLRAAASVLISRYVAALSPRPKPAAGESLVRVEISARAEVAVLKELAWFYIINRPSLATVQYGQERVIEELHGIYHDAAQEPKLHKLFPSAQQEVLREAAHDMRCVTDLVASLTEDLAFELYARLTGVKKGSILDAPAAYSR
jgi:dGTPase